MAWRIVKQPNGLFARFSDIVDNFTDLNMSEDEVLCVCEHEYNLSSDDSQTKLKNAIIEDKRWEEAIDTVRVIHGEDAVNRVMCVMNEKEE